MGISLAINSGLSVLLMKAKLESKVVLCFVPGNQLIFTRRQTCLDEKNALSYKKFT